MAFTHLHLHTEYSLLDGAARIKKMVKKAKEYAMDSVAITDHGVMFGDRSNQRLVLFLDGYFYSDLGEESV